MTDSLLVDAASKKDMGGETRTSGSAAGSEAAAAAGAAATKQDTNKKTAKKKKSRHAHVLVENENESRRIAKEFSRKKTSKNVKRKLMSGKHVEKRIEDVWSGRMPLHTSVQQVLAHHIRNRGGRKASSTRPEGSGGIQ